MGRFAKFAYDNQENDKNKILQIGILGQIKIILPFVPMSVRITNPIE